ncbi:hypothetical protein [Bacillus thuringiensis]|uniref:hypothetical protein n=1 Tax=Bacillus thuringiensis TaxID=1428 RepID=UPI000BFCD084|nr:hypothetical protein [Bacillus thuringiensis]PGT89867.1 hypothetical protein COD17_08950 [Bacillus thuringiensis]
MNVEATQLQVKNLKENLEAIKIEKEELWKKEQKLENQIRELEFDLQREKYHGLTQSQYFRAIEKTEFNEGDFQVIIGGLYGNGVYVVGQDEDMELRVSGLFNEQGKDELWVKRENVPGKRDYYKTYQAGEVPKNKQAMYKAMVTVKNKYGKMMENGEIEPKQITK